MGFGPNRRSHSVARKSRSACASGRRRRFAQRNCANSGDVRDAALYFQSRAWDFAADADCACRSAGGAIANGVVMDSAYLWIKALHIVAVIAFMAGMLYLPRLFVYHASAAAGSAQSETFKVMERRLDIAIMRPAFVVLVLSGAALVWKGA